jgi:hypothetical protein
MTRPSAKSQCTINVQPDFGDAQAGVFLEITERKVVAEHCVYPEAKVLVKERRYVDNINDSFWNLEEYLIVKEEILRAHIDVHMPVKEILSSIALEPNILADSNRTDPVVVTMGLMLDDSVKLNTYLTRFAKKRGKPLGLHLSEDLNLEVGDITRLVLSRIVL